MEQQEEENGRRQTSPTKVSNSPLLSLPADLTSDIALKLSAKYIARCRCISKVWSSLTTDSHFLKSFAIRSSLLRPSILLILKRKPDKLFVFTYPQHHQNSRSCSYEPLDSYQLEPKSLCISFTESVHGFLCFVKLGTPIVWNPTLRQFLPLPKPDKSWKSMTVFLGYDPIEGKHKVVCMPCGKFSEECRVLTLGSGKLSWRKINTKYNQLPFGGSDARCINGVVYYKACLDHMNSRVIMSFDVRSLEFQSICLPFDTSHESILITYGGRLAFVHEDNGENGYSIKLWVLEDAKRRWSLEKSFLARLKHCEKSLKTTFKLSGVTDAGEFIYLPSNILKSFYVLYFHPERNSFRTVAFKGIPGDDFSHNNGVATEDRRFHALLTFPNHFENLSSL